MTAHAAPVISSAGQSPVVPRSGEAVQVSAQISGAAQATLRWRLDGAGAFKSVAMQSAGGSWTGTIPAQAAGSLVEFSVQATGGGTADWPAAGQSALLQVEDSVVSPGLWQPGAPAVWRLLMKASDAPALAAGTAVTATAVVRDASGFSVRHGSSLRQREAAPAAYTLTFPAGQPWEGRTAVLLSADRPHAQAFGAAVFQRAGLPAASVETIEVRLNGVNAAAAGSPSYGRFAMSEAPDASWAQRQFPSSPAGNAYLLNDSGPGTHGELAYETPATGANYSETYFKQTNQAANDYADVIALTERLSNAPDATYRQEISAKLDLDQWLRFLALDALLGNSGNGLQTGRGTNVVLYSVSPAQRFVLVPFEMRAIAGLGASAGTESRSLYSADGTTGLSRMLAHRDVLPDYTRTVQALLDETFTSAVMDPLAVSVMSGWVPAAEITTVQNYLTARRASALAQLPAAYSGLTVTGEAAAVDGMAATATGMLNLSGTFPVAQVGSILVNGQPATANYRTSGATAAGTWTFAAATATGTLNRGVNQFLVEFFSGIGGTGTRLHSLTGSGIYTGGGTDVTSITAPPIITETLAAAGGVPPAAAPANSGPWRSLSAAAPAGWQNAGFDDSAWASGTPHFGFGEADQRTALTNVSGRATYYFRRTFNVDPANIGTYTALTLRLVYDDGAIVYLNGTEIARRNLPSSGVTDATPASSNRTGSSQNAFETIVVTAFLSSLQAGTNTLAVEVHNNLASGSADLSFDAEITGTRPAAPDVRWTTTGSPYRISTNLTVPAGVTLAIEPGVSVYFASGRKLSLGSSAVLKVMGTPYGRVRFSHVPGAAQEDDADIPGTQLGPPKWHGITIDGSLSPNNRISYADFVNAQVPGFDATLNINRSFCTVEFCTFRGSKFHAIRGDSTSLVVTDCYFYTDYKPGDNPLTLGLDNASEFVQLGVGGASGSNFTGNWPTGGVLKFYRNTFEALPGHNDALDVQSGKWGVTPVLDVQDNIFLGPTGDEGIDLEGDVYIAGNFFSNIKKDNFTEDMGYANALSLGDPSDAADTTAVITRNVFTRVDHVVSLKGNTGAIVEHNTIACQNNDYAFTSGSVPQTVRTSVVGFFIPEDAKTPGDGAYLAYNIMYGSDAHFGGAGAAGYPRVFSGADSGTTTAKIEMFANFIDPAIQDTAIGVRHPNNVLHASWQTVTGNPLFANVAADDYSLQAGSPAAASAPNGLDYGAGIARGCYLANVPAVFTAQTSASITVGGPGIFSYKWRLNGGAWSSPVSIAPGFFPRTGNTVRTAVLALTGLAAGLQTLEVVGQDFAGNWIPDAEATRATWTVVPATPLLYLNEIQTGSGGGIEIYNGGTSSISLSGWSLTDSAAVPARYALSGSLAPGAWLTVTAAQSGIALPAAGGTAYLFQGTTQRDAIAFGPRSPALSLGRTGRDWTWTSCSPTPSAANVAVETGSVASLRFSEWLPGGAGWVELTNTGAQPVVLDGLVLTANRPGSTPFTFPAYSILAPGGFLLLTADGSSAPGYLPFVISPRDAVLTLLEGDVVIDSVRLSRPVPGSSEGRLATGVISWLAAPSPGVSNGPAPAATPAAWLAQYGVAAASDTDADGVAALAEYAMGTHPLQSGSVSRIVPAFTGLPGQQVVNLTLQLPSNPRAGITATLEKTDSPANGAAWQSFSTMGSNGLWTGPVTGTAGPAEGGYQVVTLRFPRETGGRYFYRMRFTVP